MHKVPHVRAQCTRQLSYCAGASEAGAILRWTQVGSLCIVCTCTMRGMQWITTADVGRKCRKIEDCSVKRVKQKAEFCGGRSDLRPAGSQGRCMWCFGTCMQRTEDRQCGTFCRTFQDTDTCTASQCASGAHLNCLCTTYHLWYHTTCVRVKTPMVWYGMVWYGMVEAWEGASVASEVGSSPIGTASYTYVIINK